MRMHVQPYECSSHVLIQAKDKGIVYTVNIYSHKDIDMDPWMPAVLADLGESKSKRLAVSLS